MKLVLGTVQFGLSYGIAHDGSTLGDSALSALLTQAYEAGIDTLDTAALYGNAQARLGQLMHHPFDIVTKLGEWQPGQARMQLEQCLSALGRNQVKAVLAHRAHSLLAPQRLGEFAALKTEGLCQQLGVSVYSPEELKQVLDSADIDAVQLPANPLDQRFFAMLPELKARGITVHARSLFLQGLLLMPQAQRPLWTANAQALERWDRLPGEPLQRALDFASAQTQVDGWVVGVQNPEQLTALIAAKAKAKPDSMKALACSDVQLINPSLWPTS